MGTATAGQALQTVMRVNGVAGVIADIRAGIAACRLCPAMKPFRKAPPELHGTTRTGYMLVGEAPGLEAGIFADAGGAVLRRALAEVGDEEFRTLEDLFFLAHSVRCIPRDTKDKKRTRAPRRTECRACRPYLRFEIRALHPRLILAIGARAAEAVLGRPVKVMEEHAHRQRLGDIEVLPLLNPSPHNRVAFGQREMTIDGYTRWLTGLFGALIDDLRRR